MSLPFTTAELDAIKAAAEAAIQAKDGDDAVAFRDSYNQYIASVRSPATVLRLVEQIKRLTKQVDEYGKVMTNVVPGEHGEGEEVPATPESIRYLLKELQSEWDNSERKVSKLQAALVEQARSIGWQPIETAPKDGTEIIASKNGKLFIVDWSPQNGWTTRNGNLINPDGWFPLPKPLEAK